MWKSRFDDLWLWPFPNWLVNACNRLGGTIVLDIALLLALIAVGGTLSTIYFRVGAWFMWVAGALLAPAVFLVAVMIANGILRTVLGLTPQQKRDLEEAKQHDKKMLQTLELLERGETADCAVCGGALSIVFSDTDKWFVRTVRCDKGCTCWEFQRRKDCPPPPIES